VRYHGRTIDPVRLWSRYVEFPQEMDSSDTFLPKVQCPNPAHETLKRHFQVNAVRPLVHCFANCGISGSYEHAISVIEGLYEKFKVEGAASERERKQRRFRAHREARRIILRASAGISREPVRRRGNSSRTMPAVPADELRYQSFLPAAALHYLEKRGISGESVAAWSLGWDAEEKRLVIPARDEQGVVKFLIKRGIFEAQHPKYLYTEGFPKTQLLFGAGQIDLPMVKHLGLILVEGSIDTILNHQHGLPNTVGILGTGISEWQRRIVARISPPRIVLMFDKDVAGVRNIEIAAVRLRQYPLYVVRYPRHRADPAEMSKEEKFHQIARAVPLARFLQPNIRKARKEIHG
jgi:hypothetical protein